MGIRIFMDCHRQGVLPTEIRLISAILETGDYDASVLWLTTDIITLLHAKSITRQ